MKQKKSKRNNKMYHKARNFDDAQNFYTKYIHKTMLSCNNDKRLNSFDKAKSYAYGTGFGIACTEEFLKYKR